MHKLVQQYQVWLSFPGQLKNPTKPKNEVSKLFLAINSPSFVAPVVDTTSHTRQESNWADLQPQLLHSSKTHSEFFNKAELK